MPELPTGTLTFLFTDIEGSTELWELNPQAMGQVMVRHDEIIEEHVHANKGQIVRPRGEGDSRFAVFPQAGEAIQAAVEIQQSFATESFDGLGPLKVRIGMHTGHADLRLGDYYGSTVNRCARIRGIGHGGQCLLSLVTAELAKEQLPLGISLVDMGVHRLKGLQYEERIFQLSIPDLPDSFPPLKSLSVYQNNLPVPPTAFIGRTADLKEVMSLLGQTDVRLLTLTGPGGTGKTRLSLEIAAEMLGEYPQGVFFVDLAPISDPALVATTIAHTMGIREGGGRPPLENLKDYLADRRMLLLLDNFEQVIDAAPLIAELLSEAPHLNLLVTSRIALQIRGEREYPVSPLSLPVGVHPDSSETLLESDAIQLFIQQAQAVKPGFQLTTANATTLVEICRRLDGLPLAIEIAAARVRMLSPSVLLKRLDQSLQLLVGGAKDLPNRQQTLRNAIDWSFNMLEPEVQSLFIRLSVFAGGFDLESAGAICNSDSELDVYLGVEKLLENNLLRQADSVSDEPRFDMLQTIRDYAGEKLTVAGEQDDLRRAHGLHFSQQAELMGLHVYGAEAVSWLERIDEEHDNFRAALVWALSIPEGLPAAVQICMGLFWFWYRYGHFHEGREWCERTEAVARQASIPELHSMALAFAGMMAMWEGDLHIAVERMEQGMRLRQGFKDDAGYAISQMSYGIVLLNQGRDVEAYPNLVESAELFDQSGNDWYKATALVHLANVALGLGDFEQARARLDQAMPMVNEIGDAWQVAFALNNYGEIARAQGDYATAEEYYLQTDEQYREADALGDQARMVHTAAYLALHKGDYEGARERFTQSLTHFLELGNKRGIAECLAGLAAVAADLGQDEWAVPLLAAAQGLLTSFGAAWWPADRVEVDRIRTNLQYRLGEEKYQELWDLGEAMSMEKAIEYSAIRGP
jgi:predicted ATPase/class 3 adenylate cyclase